MPATQQPRILTNLRKALGNNWLVFCKLLHVDTSVLRGWRKNGFTYSIACRLKFELDGHIKDLQAYQEELDVIIRERRNLRGYRFPAEWDGNKHATDPEPE